MKIFDLFMVWVWIDWGGGGFFEKYVFKFEVKRKCLKVWMEKKILYFLYLIGVVLLMEEIRKKKWSINDIWRIKLCDFCFRYFKFRFFNNKVNLVYVFGES